MSLLERMRADNPDDSVVLRLLSEKRLDERRLLSCMQSNARCIAHPPWKQPLKHVQQVSFRIVEPLLHRSMRALDN
jgi:hypothetical protein